MLQSGGQQERQRERKRTRGLLLLSTILQRFFKAVTTTVCFHWDGNVSLVPLMLIIKVSKGTNI
jgi:hypothetical protein